MKRENLSVVKRVETGFKAVTRILPYSENILIFLLLDGSMVFWEYSISSIFKKIKVHNDAVSFVKILKESSLIVTSSYDSSIKFLDYHSLELIDSLDTPLPVISLDILPDKILVFSDAENMYLARLGSDTKLSQVSSVVVSQGGNATSIHIDDQNQVMITSCLDGCIRIFDTIHFNLIFKYELRSPIRNLRYIKNNNEFAFLACSNRTVFEVKEPLKVQKKKKHSERTLFLKKLRGFEFDSIVSLVLHSTSREFIIFAIQYLHRLKLLSDFVKSTPKDALLKFLLSSLQIPELFIQSIEILGLIEDGFDREHIEELEAINGYLQHQESISLGLCDILHSKF